MSPRGISTLVRIVEAGIEVFAQDGPFAAGTLDIAHKAGVAESTIFRRFDTKDNFFDECFRTAIGRTLDPLQFRALICVDTPDAGHGFANIVRAAVKRWYSSVPVATARLALFTFLSSSKRPCMEAERINQITAILAETIEREGRKRQRQSLDAKIAANSLIVNLLYRKSLGKSNHRRDETAVDTCIWQWMYGVFPNNKLISSLKAITQG